MEDDEFDVGPAAYGFVPAGAQQHQQPRLSRNTGSLRQRAPVAVLNQPHDEELELSDSGSEDVAPSPGGGFEPSQLEGSVDGGDSELELSSTLRRPQYEQPASTSEQASPSTGADSAAAAPEQHHELPGAYNAEDYAHLNVTGDVQDVFKYIGRYKPPPLEPLPLRLQPFIPEFIPALGGTDEFIKVPRPDGQPDYLGLKVLDEPAAVQSDPTLLNLQLRARGREAAGVRLQPLGCIEHTDADRHKRLASWISSIAELRRSKPATAVSYSRPMPDIEALMQEWPPELEAALKSSRLPSANLDCDLLSFAKLVCALLDVPVHSDDGVIESLHLLFSLLLAFKSNPFFSRGELGDALGPCQPDQGTGGGSRPLSTASAHAR